MRLLSGRLYSVQVFADSLFEAAMEFRKHCEGGPPELNRPPVDIEAILLVKPIYRVSMRQAMLKMIEKKTLEEQRRKQSKGR